MLQYFLVAILLFLGWPCCFIACIAWYNKRSTYKTAAKANKNVQVVKRDDIELNEDADREVEANNNDIQVVERDAEKDKTLQSEDTDRELETKKEAEKLTEIAKNQKQVDLEKEDRVQMLQQLVSSKHAPK